MDPLCHFENFLQIHTLVTCAGTADRLHSSHLTADCWKKYQGAARPAFLEAGIGWVPFWMEHMDEEYEFRPFDAPLC